MSVFIGFAVYPFQYRTVKPVEYSSNLTGVTYSVVPQVNGASSLAAVLAVLAPVWPWYRQSRASGVLVTSFFNDFYGRIIVTPAVISLGYVPSTTIRLVEIWNAYLISQTLSSYSEAGTTGLTLTGLTAPVTLGPLQSLTLTLTVFTVGPATITALYSFTFSGLGLTLTLEVRGFRSLLFAVEPNWSQSVVERLEWLTDVMESRDGTEQRVSLREHPRQFLEYQWVLLRSSINQLAALLFKQQGGVWGVPLWPQGQYLTYKVLTGDSVISIATGAYGYFVGGSLFFYGGPNVGASYEITAITLTEVTLLVPVLEDWLAGTWVTPLRLARVNEALETDFLSGEVQGGSVQFLMNDNPAQFDALPATYQGYPVWDLEPNRATPIRLIWNRKIHDYDFQTGLTRRLDLLVHPQNTIKMEYLSLTRAHNFAFRELLHHCKGKLRPFWLSSFNRDMVIVLDSLAASSTIHVKLFGYTQHLALHPMRIDIVIRLKSGLSIFRRIIDADDVVSPPGTEALTLDQPLGVDVLVPNVYIVSFVSLVRMDSDVAEISWINPIVTNIAITVKEIPA